jgi:hypothetical protein
LWYFDPSIVIVATLLAVYGLERLLVDMVRFVDRRTRPKTKVPKPPSPIILP